MPSKINLNNSINLDLSKKPKICCAFSRDNSSFSEFDNKPLSNKDNESLTEPSEIFTINLRASSEIKPFSFKDICFKKSNNSEDLILERSNL